MTLTDIHPAAVCVALLVVVLAARWVLWLIESSEPSNYERDEVPPPESTITPQDWRRQ